MSEPVCSILGDLLALTAQRGRRVIQLETKSLKSTHLPEAPALIPTLQQYGLSTDTLQKINEAYTKRARELRGIAATAIARASTVLSPNPLLPRSSSDDKVTAIFTEFYLNSLHKWIKDMEATVSSHLSVGSRCKTEGKSKPFNYGYVPLLERFFDDNPFPSHADKTFLAKKSDMTYKQIHVWFQNRRSRTKREGKTCRKNCLVQGAPLPMDRLCARMKRYTSEGGQPSPTTRARTASSAYANVISRANTRDMLLDGPAPPHAFPTPYPPSCSYDPFPTISWTFSSRHWLRSPSTTIRAATIDVDTLVDLFSQLNVKDSRGGPVQTSGFPEPSSGRLAFTTRPLPAPLPSLISKQSRSSPRRYPPLPVIRAPDSRCHVFQPSSCEVSLLTLVPSTTQMTVRAVKNVKSTCTVAPLPQRTSRSADNTCQSLSHASDASAFLPERSLHSVLSGSGIRQCEAKYSIPDLSRTYLHMVSAH